MSMFKHKKSLLIQVFISVIQPERKATSECSSGYIILCMVGMQMIMEAVRSQEIAKW